MSYCVNCGVELEEAAKKCPLCNTPVINPNIKINEEVAASYSDKIAEIPESMKKRFTAFIITMVMLIPNIVCFLVNIIFRYDYTWVWLLNATSVLIWAFIVLPLMWNKKAGIVHVLIDAAVAMGYAYVIYYIEKGSGWFLECAVPIIIVLAALFGFFIEWVKRIKPHWTYVCIALFTEIILASVPIEITIVHYIKGTYMPTVSLIISASCVAIIAFFIAVASNKKLKAWLDRKFFVD